MHSTSLLTTPTQRQTISDLESRIQKNGSLIAQLFPWGLKIFILSPEEATAITAMTKTFTHYANLPPHRPPDPHPDQQKEQT